MPTLERQATHMAHTYTKQTTHTHTRNMQTHNLDTNVHPRVCTSVCTTVSLASPTAVHSSGPRGQQQQQPTHQRRPTTVLNQLSQQQQQPFLPQRQHCTAETCSRTALTCELQHRQRERGHGRGGAATRRWYCPPLLLLVLADTHDSETVVLLLLLLL